MPLHQRQSGQFDRRPSISSSHHRRYASSSTTDEDIALPSEERDRALFDAYQRANTELNKIMADRDKLQVLYDQTIKKLSDSNKVVGDLKDQAQTFKEEIANLRQRNLDLTEASEKLKFENDTLTMAKTAIQAKYDNLRMRYEVLDDASPTNPMVSTIPERPKSSRSPGSGSGSGTSSGKKESREDRDRERDRDRDRDRDRERGRGRDKEKEKKEQEAEKHRLSRRFEKERPPLTNQRSSYQEGWGPSGRSTSTTRNRQKAAPPARIQPPSGPYQQQAPSAKTPRTTTDPYGTSNYSGSYTYDDVQYGEGDFEDGNYHMHPLSR
ncbi:hypothetical protein B0I35DRAFT_407985 [Stachybotrys elegans]|uniref:Uncharacterized protein n=1 Tax=Stachybotrys elegans TaxID=80388 RepID=A0A8K0SU37_9HYPO|nr:hypothetical protein B0I35DRAFT_407985 [Stachybotrys elegans]